MEGACQTAVLISSKSGNLQEGDYDDGASATASLRVCLEALVPEVLDKILSRDEIRKGNAITMNKIICRKESGRKSFLKPLCAAAAALILVAGSAVAMGHYNLANGIETVVTMDVNPSVALNANRAASVVGAEALNQDGAKVLEGLDLKGMGLEEAAKTVAEAMVEAGYLNELTNSVLISVKNEDPEKSAAFEKLLAESVGAALENESINGAVISLRESMDEELAGLSKKLDISGGKAMLIQNIMEKAPDLSAEELSKLNINDLCLIAQEWMGEMDGLNFTGTPSNGKFIAPEVAVSNVEAHANCSYTGLADVDAELDYKDGRFIYQVKITGDTSELNCSVDAETGEVLEKIHSAAALAKNIYARQTGNTGTPSETGTPQLPGVSQDTGTLIKKAAEAIGADGLKAGEANVSFGNTEENSEPQLNIKFGEYEYTYPLGKK